MPDTHKTTQNGQDNMKSIDDYLDEALQETFPASDPVAISQPDVKIPATSGRNEKNVPQ